MNEQFWLAYINSTRYTSVFDFSVEYIRGNRAFAAGKVCW